MNHYSDEFLRAIPKTDLHVHLDGSLRVATLIDLAKQYKITLPSYSEEGLMDTVFKEKYADLVEYLNGFQYTVAVMQTPEALERVAYELVYDSYNEGVRYIEPRFAPQLHANKYMSVEDVLIAVNNGFLRAANEINSQDAIMQGNEPRFEYGIIGCAMRMFTGEFASYFKRFVEIHRYMPEDDLFGLSSLDLVQTLIHVRDELGLPIVGFDLAGAEEGYPAVDHKRAFDFAHKNFLKKTIHAGEAYGPDSIFQAIADCHADRIGHGTHLFDAHMGKYADEKERENYVKRLWQYIADRRINIEVCLSSNLQTMPYLKSLKDHPFGRMLENRLSVTFCTDNRLVSRTSVSNEIRQAVTHFEIPSRMLKNLIIYGFKRSFFSGTYLQKRHYVWDVIDYYDKMQNEFNPSA